MAEKRDRQVHFLMSRSEYQRLCEKTERLGISNQAAYLRKMALDGYCVQLDIPELKKMTGLLGRCNNNLNQYARKANQTGSIYKGDILDLKKRLDEIYRMAEKILIRLNALQ